LIPMRKITLLLGSIGGAMVGYLFSNKKLRDDLGKSKDAEEAARLLGKHLQKDGKSFAKQVRDFIESEEVQSNMTKAKKLTAEKFQEVQKELRGAMGTVTEKAKSTGRKTAKKDGRKAKSTARKTAKRVRSKTRKVS